LAPGDGYPKSIGTIFTQHPLATPQTMTVDIKTNPGKKYQVALYFVDWEDAGRRTTVEMFELETKDILAPGQIVRDLTNGEYLIYKYINSVRFRINHVSGQNATLSMIFFDPAKVEKVILSQNKDVLKNI
jgi:hypothetical protein